MATKLADLVRLVLGRQPPRRMLDGYIDSLLQTFENCRPGLSDEIAHRGPAAVEAYFLSFYQKESARLAECIRLQEKYLPAPRAGFREKVDELIRRVVIPAYARLAGPFTLRERNDFYLTPPVLHGLERLGWGVAGLVLGSFAIWAPFIPIWEKEWILVFAVAGLFLPNLRRLLSLRRYQSDLNRLVERVDDEIWRMDMAYLTQEVNTGPSEAGLEGSPAVAPEPEADASGEAERSPRRGKLREGER